LHDIGSADFKRLSDYATKFLLALWTAYKAHTGKKGKRSQNQMANVAKTWSAFPGKVSLTAKQKAVVKEYNKVAGMDTAQIHKNIRHVIDALRNTPRNRRRVSKNAFRAYIFSQKRGVY
jgi:hypothetical protein